MDTSIPQPSIRKAIFQKWKTWRNRLRHEFINLLVQQRHFHELKAITKPYIGTATASELARSMTQGYLAFTLTALRRIAEFPRAKTSKSKEIVSLPTLLLDVQANAHLVTRTHQRRRYKKAMKHLPERIYIDAADRVHDAVTNGDDILQPHSVERDLHLVKRTVKRISTLTDKVYAHIERDRRRIPKRLGFNKADDAIKALFGILRKYSLCLFGEEVVMPRIEDFSVARDLRKIWPNNEPVSGLPSVIDEVEP